MPKFQVDVYEVWRRSVTVEAATEDEAKEKANELIESGEDGTRAFFEYSHTLDLDDWWVEEVPADNKLTVDYK